MKIFLKSLIILVVVYLFVLKPFYDFSHFHFNPVPKEFSYMPFKGYSYNGKKVVSGIDCPGDACYANIYFWEYAEEISMEQCFEIGGAPMSAAPFHFYVGCEAITHILSEDHIKMLKEDIK